MRVISASGFQKKVHFPFPHYYVTFRFLSHDAIHSADYAVTSPSVCHTPVFCRNGSTHHQTVFTISLPYRSFLQCQMCVDQINIWYDITTGWRGRWMQGVWKNSDFRPITRFISEMIQGRAIITFFWNANRKPHPSFRMVPCSMTLSDRPSAKSSMTRNIARYLRDS